ncbi:uncharacterized protein LOC135195529 [Macrobrachium nipponense]|uniref:uncharacterized protein LOC135195529 n=1 Tax=Macrobrachium nipponense TaxID=159736 RepID=UPI0030C824A1
MALSIRYFVTFLILRGIKSSVQLPRLGVPCFINLPHSNSTQTNHLLYPQQSACNQNNILHHLIRVVSSKPDGNFFLHHSKTQRNKPLVSHKNHLPDISTTTHSNHSSSFKKLELQERTNYDSLRSNLRQTQGQSKPLWFVPVNIDNNTNSVLRNVTSVNNFDHMHVSKIGNDSYFDLTDYNLHRHSKSVAYNALPFRLNVYQAFLTGAKNPLKRNSSTTRTSRKRSVPLTSRVTNFGGIRNKRQNPVYLVQLQPRPVRVVQKKISSPLNLINILSFDSINDDKQFKSFPPKSTSSQISEFSFTDTVKSTPLPASDSEVSDLVSVLSAAPPPVQKTSRAITRQITDSDVVQVLAFLSRTLPVNRQSKTKVEHIFTMKPSLDSNIPVTFRPSPKDPFLTPPEGNKVANSHNFSSVNNAPSSFPLPLFTPSLPRFSQEPLPVKILHQNTLGPISTAAPFILPTNEPSSFFMEVNHSSTSLKGKPENNSNFFFPTFPSSLFLQEQLANSVLENQNVHSPNKERPSRILLPPTSSQGELPPFVEGINTPTTATFEHNGRNITDLKFLFNPSLKGSLLSKNVADNQMPKLPWPVFGPWKPITSPPKVLSSAGGDSEKEENLVFTNGDAQEDDISISTDLKPNIFSPTRNFSQTGALIFKDQNFLYVSVSTPENQSTSVTQPEYEPELLTQLKLNSPSSIVSDASLHPLAHAITGQHVPQSRKEELHRPQTFIQTQSVLQENQVHKDKPMAQSHPQNVSHTLTAVLQQYEGNDLQSGQHMFLTEENINLDPHNQPITKSQEHSGLQLLSNSQFQQEIPANELQTKFQSDQKVQVKPEAQQFHQGQLQTNVGSESHGENQDKQQLQIKLQMQSQLQTHFQSEPHFELQSEIHLPFMSHLEFKHQTESQVEQEAQSQPEKQKGDFQLPSHIQLESNLQTKPQLQSTQTFLAAQTQSEGSSHADSHGISEAQSPIMQEVLLEDYNHNNVDPNLQLQTENMFKHLIQSQSSDGLGQELQSGPQFQVQPHIQSMLQLPPNRDFLSEEISHIKSQFHSEPQPLFKQQVITEPRLNSVPQNEDSSFQVQPSSEAAKALRLRQGSPKVGRDKQRKTMY